MHWTTYMVDIDDLCYLFSCAQTKQISSGGCCIYDDRQREQTFDYILEKAMENAILKRSGHHTKPLLRKCLSLDINKYYYDLIGYQFEQRMLEILDTRLIHHTCGEIMKLHSVGSTLFISRKQLHLK
jgi:hypothetical protein